jgi:hypothetical protein
MVQAEQEQQERIRETGKRQSAPVNCLRRSVQSAEKRRFSTAHFENEALYQYVILNRIIAT